jgi:hypothetical protein
MTTAADLGRPSTLAFPAASYQPTFATTNRAMPIVPVTPSCGQPGGPTVQDAPLP